MSYTSEMDKRDHFVCQFCTSHVEQSDFEQHSGFAPQRWRADERLTQHCILDMLQH